MGEISRQECYARVGRRRVGSKGDPLTVTPMFPCPNMNQTTTRDKCHSHVIFRVDANLMVGIFLLSFFQLTNYSQRRQTRTIMSVGKAGILGWNMGRAFFPSY